MVTTRSDMSVDALVPSALTSRRAALQKLGAIGAGATLIAATRPSIAAQEATPSPVVGALAIQDVSLEQAQAAVDAALAKAAEIGTRMNIAIVDVGANLKAFARMDGAWLASIDIAIKKARTSAMLLMPTADLDPLVQPGQPLFGIGVSNDGLITFPGGVPLVGADGAIIGAIGVSGSTVEDDQLVAETGAAAIA
jgi:uncharacterized protein GlcG (DUF336 family)